MTAAVQQRTFISSFDPNFDPSILRTSPALPPLSAHRAMMSTSTTMANNGARPRCSRDEVVPHDGPGTAVYVRQPTRQQLKANNGLLSNPNRPYYIKDPLNQPFLDVDGKECGPRWILIDPKGENPLNMESGGTSAYPPVQHRPDSGLESDVSEASSTKPIVIVEKTGAVRGELELSGTKPRSKTNDAGCVIM
ncbi:hypothetical protein OIV83_001628 [Microbotryomycetes sp. JL201]|nr:hypothetical protein OIV83_001628 [Microbotryomycetes sp. JL201]